MNFVVRWLMVAILLVSMAHAETAPETSTTLTAPTTFMPPPPAPPTAPTQPEASAASTPPGLPTPDQASPTNANPQPSQAPVTQSATVAAPVAVSNALPGTYSWFAARNVCQGISAGWHLPTIDELLSRTISFPYAGRYWSSSEYGIGIAWSYDTINKQASLNAVDNQLYVHCEP